jgi:restriction endonuclease Mrr
MRQETGANKAIMVTTGRFGKKGQEFAQNMGIDLIDGKALLRLLAQYTGIQARIGDLDDHDGPTPIDWG